MEDPFWAEGCKKPDGSWKEKEGRRDERGETWFTIKRMTRLPAYQQSYGTSYQPHSNITITNTMVPGSGDGKIRSLIQNLSCPHPPPSGSRHMGKLAPSFSSQIFGRTPSLSSHPPPRSPPCSSHVRAHHIIYHSSTRPSNTYQGAQEKHFHLVSLVPGNRARTHPRNRAM